MRGYTISMIAIALAGCGDQTDKHSPVAVSATNSSELDPSKSDANHFGKPDWKLVGVAKTPLGEPATCFYDQTSLDRSAGNHLKAWIECLADGDMDAIGKTAEKTLVNKAAEKIVRGYVPPYVKANMPDSQKAAFEFVSSSTFSELVADEASIEPSLRMFIELDCAGKAIRLLNAEAPKQSMTGTSQIGDWEPVPPDSTAQNLGRIACAG